MDGIAWNDMMTSSNKFSGTREDKYCTLAITMFYIKHSIIAVLVFTFFFFNYL